MVSNQHLSTLIAEQAKKYGNKVALKYRDDERGEWLPVSWNRFQQYVKAVGRSLAALGVARQERIAVFSQNKPECLYVAFGGYSLSAITIPFYATSSAAQVAFMMNDAEVRYLFVGEQLQYDTAMDALSLCHHIDKIIILDSAVKKRPTDCISMSFAEFLSLGKQGNYDDVIAQRQAEAKDDDIADILYTSGTTGNPKGVILTYEMYMAGFQGNSAALKFGEGDVMLNFLPFTHIFERAFAYWGLASGAVLAVNLRPNDVLRSLQEVQPTCMASVPRFWEKVYQGVQERIESGKFVERKLMKNALVFGEEYWEQYGSKGVKAPLAKRLKYAFYDKTIYKLLRKTLGLEQGNFFPTAGAAVSPDVEKFVHAVGIYMVVGYGLTESTATVSCDRKNRAPSMGSVGIPIPTVEVKIGKNDEVLLRGKTITPGYYKNDNATKAAIDADGWFHTGDAGYLKNGELYLKERIKDLFKTSNGKYIAPQIIETKITIDRYVEQCVIVADKRKFVSALIIPNYPLLEKEAEKLGVVCATREELCSNEKIRHFFKERIDTLQQDLAHYEQIKAFALLPKAFTMESGELTNTLKVKRNIVYQRYADVINQLYIDAEREFVAK